MDEIQKTKLGDLDSHVAGAICYVPVMMVNYIAPPIFLLMEPKENTTIRFHAAQSLLVTATWFASMFLGFLIMMAVPVLLLVVGSATGLDEVFGLVAMLFYAGGALFTILASFAGLFAHVGLALFTAMQKNPRVPLLGGIAARFAGQPV